MTEGTSPEAANVTNLPDRAEPTDLRHRVVSRLRGILHHVMHPLDMDLQGLENEHYGNSRRLPAAYNGPDGLPDPNFDPAKNIPRIGNE